MASLLMILPYKASSSVIVQRDDNWINYANSFRAYKERTGISTTVMTLDDINASLPGTDEQERIKQYIFHWAKDKFSDHPDEFLGVMMVGKGDIMPARYILRGHTPEGDPYYSLTTGRIFDSCYRFDVCDAYYANLWDPEDATQSFDNWNNSHDASRDAFYGELYYSNYRGTDGNSLHPQVGVGRILCNTPDEFLDYLQKVIQYEAVAATHASREKVLLISTDDFDSAASNNNILKAELEDDFEVSHFKKQGSTFIMESPGGGTESTSVANRYLERFMNSQQPRLVHYFGHGNSSSWASFNFGRTDASNLLNRELPAIVFSSGCETGQFSSVEADESFPLTAYEGTDQACIAESFQIDAQPGGAVVYLGAFSGTRPETFDLAQPFFEAIRDREEFAGRAWMTALESFIDRHNLDDQTGTPRDHDRDWPDPDTDYYYPANPAANRFFQVYNLNFFGDPTLRLKGIPEVDEVAVPYTTIDMNRWVNRGDLNRFRSVDGPYFHEVGLHAADPDGLGVLETRYRYRRHSRSGWTTWQSGNSFIIPIDLEGMEGESGEVEYYSINLQLAEEAHRSATFGYDFSNPVSQIEINGSLLASIPAGEIEDVENFRIIASDPLSGIREIHYRVNEGLFRTDSGHEFSIALNRCFSFPTTITFYAEDYAGNTEALQRVELKPLPLTGRIWDAACSSGFARMRGGYFDRPIDTLGDTIFLEELEAMIDWPPEDPRKEVLFEFSGPLTSAAQPPHWQRIGTAFRHEGRKSFQALWDTKNFDIKNGFYWLQAVPEMPDTKNCPPSNFVASNAKLMLINNYRQKEDFRLSLKAPSLSLKPGEKITLKVNFNNLQLGDLNHVRVGLATDRKLWLEKQDIAFVKPIQDCKEREQGEYSFELTLSPKVTGLDEIRMMTFIQSKEIAFLPGQVMTLSVLPRDVSIKGMVRDTMGKPLSTVVWLRQNKSIWKAKTNKKGVYNFRKIPAGPYSLSIQNNPKGYRLAYAKDRVFSFTAMGKDVRHNFLFTKVRNQLPDITSELSWKKSMEYKLFYGLAYGERSGTAISKIELAVEDKLNHQWWHSDGYWSKKESWFAPPEVVGLTEFLKDKYDKGAFNIPVKNAWQEFEKLSTWNNRFGNNRDVKVWLFPFDQQLAFATGWKVLHVRVWNEDGFYRQTPFYTTWLNAQFEVLTPEKAEPLSVQFIDRTEGFVLSHRWDFGDGNFGTGLSVKHQYQKAGKYQVTLHVSGPYVDDSISQMVNIIKVKDLIKIKTGVTENEVSAI